MRLKSRQASLIYDSLMKQVSLSLDGGALPGSTKAESVPNGTDSGHATQSTSSQTIEVNTGIGFLDHVLLPLLTMLNIDVPCSSKTFGLVTPITLSRRPPYR
jgi:imidazoleglycerol phosphate dehydratase HisB